MSAVIVVTPLIVASWPTISIAVTAALGTLGYAVTQDPSARQRVRKEGKTRAEIEVEESEILEGAEGTGEELVVEKAGLRAVFSRDARGALKLCMEGEGYTKAELRRIGEELIGRVTQQYVYHKVMTEMQERNLQVVDEEVSEDRTIKIRVRNW
jgi:hypothetical protein